MGKGSLYDYWSDTRAAGGLPISAGCTPQSRDR
jgi:hypothetical protein